MSNNTKHASNDLQLALRAQAVSDDDFDPELLYGGIDEEEEEEEEGEEEEDGDGEEELDEESGAEDRGDDFQPTPDEDKTDTPVEESLDHEALAELAGDGGKAKMIPHARFNEVNESLKQERAARLQLEEELARARGTQPSTVKPEAAPVESQAFDFDAAEKRYMDALMDGDTDAAAALRKEIRAEERKDFSQQSEQSAKQAAEAERQRVQNETAQEQTQRVLDDAIEKYPFLDHASEAADSDAIEDVIARRDLYIKQGVPFAQALEKAVEKVAPRYQTETPAPTPASSKTATVDQIKRNLEREKRIPAAMPGVGERGKDIDYANLSEDEFDSLSEQEKRKARGDFVKESA